MVKGTWGSTVKLHHCRECPLNNARESTPAHGHCFDGVNYLFHQCHGSGFDLPGCRGASGVLNLQPVQIRSAGGIGAIPARLMGADGVLSVYDRGHPAAHNIVNCQLYMGIFRKGKRDGSDRIERIGVVFTVSFSGSADSASASSPSSSPDACPSP